MRAQMAISRFRTLAVSCCSCPFVRADLFTHVRRNRTGYAELWEGKDMDMLSVGGDRPRWWSRATSSWISAYCLPAFLPDSSPLACVCFNHP
ncbi:hypothetical protein C8Q80DRAFT_404153 [Daedaleopsis nitida]|nr:hypothetical protein C8Q80DRAFT_404153 [Daedaleopsis nitida]